MTAKMTVTEARRINDIRTALHRALTKSTAVQVKADVMVLLCDLDALIEGRSLSSVDMRALERRDTLPCPPPVSTERSNVAAAVIADGWVDVDLADSAPGVALSDPAGGA
jgi:hypothetical protein